MNLNELFQPNICMYFTFNESFFLLKIKTVGSVKFTIKSNPSMEKDDELNRIKNNFLCQ
jgi:hypothetical protein